jgi:hypothetical protein
MWSYTPSQPSNASSRKGFRPCVEVLEDRCCPATVRVSSAIPNLIGDQGPNPMRLVGQGADSRLRLTYAAPAAKHTLPVVAARRHHRRHVSPPLPASVRQHILVNGVPLSAAGAALLQHLGIRPLPGAYWYDSVSGAVGAIGQGTSGFLPAGLPLGGPLQAGASNGTSGVFVNGRQLTAGEETFLESVLGSPIAPGSYFLDANGDAGLEGGPVLVNLVQLAQQRGIGHVSPLSTYDRTGISVLGDGSFIGILNSDGSSVTFA